MRYEKGRKGESRRHIIDAASQRFRRDGIAATGLAAVMADAGLTNGAFYPHFGSKAQLVRESVNHALMLQADQVGEALAQGGVDAVIDLYLSVAHRDTPEIGCASAALLPEVAREPEETQAMYRKGLARLTERLTPSLAGGAGSAQALLALLLGTLQMARATRGDEVLSRQILLSGAQAARQLTCRLR